MTTNPLTPDDLPTQESLNDLEEYSDHEDLLLSPSYCLRVFNRASDNQTIIGLLIEEVGDSFLVALPARLLKSASNDEITAEEYIPFPYMRLMKYNLSEVTPIFGIFEENYLTYLRDVALEKYPEYADFLPEDLFEELVESEEEMKMTEELEEKLALASSLGSILKTPKSIN